MAMEKSRIRMELSPPSVLFDGTLAHFSKGRDTSTVSRNSTNADGPGVKGPVVATTWVKGP